MSYILKPLCTYAAVLDIQVRNEEDSLWMPLLFLFHIV